MTYTNNWQELSNVKRMDIWTAVQRVLEKNPGIRAKFLIPELEEKTGLARSTINEHLTSFDIKKKIYREKGRYWLKKPETTKRSIKSQFGFFEWLKHRNEQKILEEERVRKELLARKWTSMELMAKANPDIGEVFQNWLDVEKKTRKELGLDSE